MKLNLRLTWPVIGAVGLLLLCSPAYCIWYYDGPNYDITGSVTTMPGGTRDISCSQSVGNVTIPGGPCASYELTANFFRGIHWSSPVGKKAPKLSWFCAEGDSTWSYLGTVLNPPASDADGDASSSCSDGHTYSVESSTVGSTTVKYGSYKNGREWPMLEMGLGTIRGYGHATCWTVGLAAGDLTGGINWRLTCVVRPRWYPRQGYGWGMPPTYPITPGWSPTMGGTNTGGDPINLATGQHAYLPGVDLAAYNPNGPTAVYHRNWWSERTMDYGYYSPGLSGGWVDNYDVSIEGTGPTYTLTYPNGAEETLDSNTHRGPAGSGYTVYALSDMGPPWEIQIRFASGVKWHFNRSGESYPFMLTRIEDNMGRYIKINREHYSDLYEGDYEPRERLTSVTDDHDKPLLTFTDNDTKLSSVQDAYGRKVTYTFDTDGLLSAVSEVQPSSATTTRTHWRYTYYHDKTISWAGPTPMYFPHMASVEFTNPAGGKTTQDFHYEDPYRDPLSDGSDMPCWLMCVRVKDVVDGNGNKTEFDYSTTGQTRVTVKTRAGVVQSDFKVLFQAAPDGGYRCTGRIDGNGKQSSVSYTDGCLSPTTVTDELGKSSHMTYDQFGNLTSFANPKGTSTTLTYDYTAFELGRLTSVTEGTKSPMTLTYYEPSGLVHTVSYPIPGSSGGTTTATVTYTYDELGNVLTKTSPGPNGTNVTVTMNYTTDGLYSQPAKRGQPLTITDAQGHTVHLRYDAKGNVTSATDPLGRTTNAIYNVADQPTTVILPPRFP